MVVLKEKDGDISIIKPNVRASSFSKDELTVVNYYSIRETDIYHMLGNNFIFSYFSSAFTENLAGNHKQYIELYTLNDVENFLKNKQDSYYIIYNIDTTYNNEKDLKATVIVFMEVNLESCHPTVKNFIRQNNIDEILSLI